MKIKFIIFFGCVLFFISISTRIHAQSQSVFPKAFRAEIQLSSDTLVYVEFRELLKAHSHNWYMLTAGDTHAVQSWLRYGDSIWIVPSVYQTEIRVKYVDSLKQLQGIYRDYSRLTEYTLPFKAQAINTNHPHQPAYASSLKGRWLLHFGQDTSLAKSAIGIFEQNGNQLQGTFLSTTGDYGFFSGIVRGKHFELSSFEGSHAYWFGGELLEDGSLHGVFRSGPSYHSDFIATQNEHVQLPESDVQSVMKPGINQLHFRFPDADSTLVSTDDDRFHNKVVLVQISGSWCFNCKDEIRFLVPLYQSLQAQGLEMILLNYERKTDWKMIQQILRQEKAHFRIPYPVLYGGLVSKAAETLPAMRGIAGYPTLLMIDRKGIVRYVEVGINGPATGHLFDEWKFRVEQKILHLLHEKP